MFAVIDLDGAAQAEDHVQKKSLHAAERDRVEVAERPAMWWIRRVGLTARELLADEIRILREFTNAPVEKLRELIQLNKELHPADYIKLD